MLGPVGRGGLSAGVGSGHSACVSTGPLPFGKFRLPHPPHPTPGAESEYRKVKASWEIVQYVVLL